MDPSLDARILKTEERKEQSSAKKATIVELAGMVMVTIFWDNKGMFLILPGPGMTITAARYYQELKKLSGAIQNKGGVS